MGPTFDTIHEGLPAGLEELTQLGSTFATTSRGTSM